MCFPSTLQPEGSISLRGVTLAKSPALDQNRAEQNGAGERTAQDGRDYNRTGQERKDQTEQGGKGEDRTKQNRNKTDECSRDALSHSARSVSGLIKTCFNLSTVAIFVHIQSFVCPLLFLVFWVHHMLKTPLASYYTVFV